MATTAAPFIVITNETTVGAAPRARVTAITMRRASAEDPAIPANQIELSGS